MIAPGADRILALRRAGQRPGEGVIVSTIGRLPVEWLVEADLDTEHDWVMMVNLTVWVVASTKTPTSKLNRLLWQIRQQKPETLYLWLDDAQKGYQIRFWPTVDSIRLPIDKWEWVMDVEKFEKWQNDTMRDYFSGSVPA